MKKKVIGVIVGLLLLTGCGGQAEAIPGVDNIAGNATIDEAGNVENDLPAETEAEEEAYVLTFESTTVDGEALTSECFADSKLTMLNVWATYCGPCLEEMPYLGEIAAAYDKSEFQIIGAVSDVQESAKADTIAEAKELITRTGANYTHVLSSESLYTNLLSSVSAVPTTFFINQKGEVLGYMIGAYPKEDWEEIINELLATVEQ